MQSVATLTGVLVLLYLCAGIRAQTSSSEGDCNFDFGYTSENGPATWGEHCPACNGDHQSPINIDPSQVDVLDLPAFVGSFPENQNEDYYFWIENDGITVTLYFNTSEPLTLHGGLLDDTYVLSKLQFCWGSNDSVGSEHTFNGERYPLESEFVLYKQGADEVPENELRIAHLHPLCNVPNPALSTLSDLLSSVVQPGSKAVSSDPITYSDIFSGYPTDDFYGYIGSLTTPPCTEGVLWLVFPPNLPGHGVTEDVLESFRELMSEDGPLVNNFRPVQPLKARQLEVSSRSTQLHSNCGQPHY